MPARGLPILLLLLLAVPTAQAEDLMVYGSHDGYPKYYEEHGTARGIVVDITRLCLDQLQVPHRIRLLPWARAYSPAARGAGAIIGLSKSRERLAQFDFSAPIFTERIVLVVKQGREFPYRDIADLEGKRVGVSIGTSYGTAFDQAVSDGVLTLVGFNETRSALAMLQRGRIDAILMGSSADIGKLAAASSDLQGAAFSVLPEPFKTDSKYLGIARSLHMRGLLERFDQCLQRGYASGEFEAIVQRYDH